MKKQDLRKYITTNTALEDGIISILRKGAHDLKTVVILYQSSDGSITERETEPYDIKEGKYWGFCIQSNGIRQFTIGKILKASITENKYRPQWAVQIL